LHPNPARRDEKNFSYNASGDRIQTSMVLSGTLELQRRHENALDVAPPPPGASGGVNAPETVPILDETPDQFGNITSRVGANARCRNVGFDGSYADLPTQETVLAGPSDGTCGTEPLNSQAIYDEGLRAITEAHDLHGEVTLFGYDELGR